MRTPMDMTASKGRDGMVTTFDPTAGVGGRESRERSDEEPPKRSVAVALAWIWDADITLRQAHSQPVNQYGGANQYSRGSLTSR